jgi:hypothetical protein
VVTAAAAAAAAAAETPVAQESISISDAGFHPMCHRNLAPRALATTTMTLMTTVTKSNKPPLYLVLVLADASSQDCVHVDALGRHLRGVLRDELTQLQPQLVLALALNGAEGVVVQHA